MLTPPGLKGKQYRVTGTAYPRLARPSRRRRYTVFGVLGVMVLAVLGWGSVQLFGVFGGGKAAAVACGGASAGPSAGPSGSAAPGASGARAVSAVGPAGASGAAAPGASASHPAAAFAPLVGVLVPKPSTITVNVLNATDRAGLAGQTAALLKKRGFVIGKVGNAPAALQNKITGTAQVMGNKAAATRMTVLGSEVAGASPATDLRKDASVDLVLGNGFTALATPAQEAQTLALAAKPVPAPSPGHC